MFVLKNFVVAIANVIDMILNIYVWVLIINAVLSWIHVDSYNPVVNLIQKIAGFVLDPIRRKIPLIVGQMDFTPIVVIIIISFSKNFLVQTLFDIARNLG